ncbi:LON peptidase substrate-binding domain-containing protein [Paralimibaculum aggregatum]|uniref:LON peptidase substrate-binding domain-containing protein n=1 Tax=Paralimibaculum aggregatum TaxID=3036245 RepID=A0ABQ6LPQ2_9RHOB|nr:LON peptidase substrate-binding domain-containing protein [Limibaculum sp. NKW23]GMG82898.1 LON peptidase substrate-binding domain-containing protein [Limibaculum sp. NKW23]
MTRRFAPADLPDAIPVFPLPGALLLPRARLPLNIFEPRYLAMLDDTLKTEHRLIGMVQPMAEAMGDRGGDRPGPPRLQRIGCAGRVTSLSETEDGRYLIALTGVSRFRVEGEIDGFTPYRRVRPLWADFTADLEGPEEDRGFDRTAFLALLKRYFDASQLASDWSSLQDAPVEMLINSLSIMCPFSVEEKQALLETPCLSDRRATLMALLRFAIASSGDESKMQ